MITKDSRNKISRKIAKFYFIIRDIFPLISWNFQILFRPISYFAKSQKPYFVTMHPILRYTTFAHCQPFCDLFPQLFFMFTFKSAILLCWWELTPMTAVVLLHWGLSNSCGAVCAWKGIHCGFLSIHSNTLPGVLDHNGTPDIEVNNHMDISRQKRTFYLLRFFAKIPIKLHRRI